MSMETVVLVVLALVVALVAIDAVARSGHRGGHKSSSQCATSRDPQLVSTQTIVIDLSKRDQRDDGVALTGHDR